MTDFSFDILSQRLRELAFLNRGVKITIEDERTQKKHEFFYKGGLLSFVEHLNRAKTAIHAKVVYFEGEKDGVGVEIAMQWNDGYTENVFSFANNINTIEGGTHLIGFRSALTRTINSYAVSSGLLKKDDENLQGEDVREGLTAVISVKVPEPQFEGQTKTKLGNSEVKGIVEALVNEKFGSYLSEHPSEAKKIVVKGRRSGAGARSNAQGQRLGAAQRRARFRLSAGQAGRLPGARPGIERTLSGRGRFRRRFGQAGTRPAQPGDSAAQRQNSQRRKSAFRQNAFVPGNSPDDYGARAPASKRTTTRPSCVITRSSS